jgi:cellulose synthase/poly-beta-1,6-N-acetylglucosamine synthase-like glycosyltransferase
MLIYLLVIFSGYFLFLIFLILGFVKVTVGQPVHSHAGFVSIIVAVRNEAATIPNLLESLAKQQYPNDKFEIILVDDHSTDTTADIISTCINFYTELKIIKISAAGVGKKRAITQGIEAAQGEIILTTDADCTVPPTWIAGMLNSFKENTQMVIGAVKIKSGQTFFSKLQALEFSSVLGSGIALMGWGQAVMCNGASLAFSKTAFNEVHGYEGNFEIPSGDDEFLMRKIDKMYKEGIVVVSQRDCVVETLSLNSVHDFIQQRLRWAGKWKANDSIFARLVAVFILLVQLSWVILLCLTTLLASGKLLLLVLLKIWMEFSFILLVSHYLKLRFRAIAFIALQILYPLYVIYIGIASQVASYQWKGRS